MCTRTTCNTKTYSPVYTAPPTHRIRQGPHSILHHPRPKPLPVLQGCLHRTAFPVQRMHGSRRLIHPCLRRTDRLCSLRQLRHCCRVLCTLCFHLVHTLLQCTLCFLKGSLVGGEPCRQCSHALCPSRQHALVLLQLCSCVGCFFFPSSCTKLRCGSVL